MYKLNVIALAGLALIVSAAAMAAEHPDEASMAPAQVAALFSVVNGKADAAEADGGPVIRWQIAVGQTSQLALRKESPIFSRLRYYDRFEFEFRVVSGEISSLDMQALGHVSGAYQCKVHEWHLSVHSTAKPDWNRRQIELARPAWYPWDSPDGEGGDFFRLSSLALSPGRSSN